MWIMDTLELKRSFHHLIDSIDNDDLLLNFYELLKKPDFSKRGAIVEKIVKI